MRMMPKELRKNVILGRYVLDGTKLSDFLLSQMHEYTSDECNCIIFDPAQTLHRGGLSNTKTELIFKSDEVKMNNMNDVILRRS